MSDDFDIEIAEQILDELREGLAERRKTMQPNECPACGAFRLDGQPPEIHTRDCWIAGETITAREPGGADGDRT